MDLFLYLAPVRVGDVFSFGKLSDASLIDFARRSRSLRLGAQADPLCARVNGRLPVSFVFGRRLGCRRSG